MSKTKQDYIEFLKHCETGNIADAYVRLGLVNDLMSYTVNSNACHPIRFEDHFAGAALTVRFEPLLPGDKGTGMFDVLTKAEPGSIVIMSGVKDRCYMGDVLAHYAAFRKMGALVADGYVRDSKGCIEAGIPVFSAGGTTAAKGKTLYSITAVNEPIVFHGIRIEPGDILVGDCDGIIRIPERLLEKICHELETVMECEKEYAQAFANPSEDMLERLLEISHKSH